MSATVAFLQTQGQHGSFSQRALFHGSQINHATCWTPLTAWLTLTNKTKPAASVRSNKTAEWYCGVPSRRQRRPSEEHMSTILICVFSIALYHHHNTKKMKGGGRNKESTRNSGSSLQGLYLHWVQHSGSSVDKYSHILIFQLAWLLFSKHMQTQRGVH